MTMHAPLPKPTLVQRFHLAHLRVKAMVIVAATLAGLFLIVYLPLRVFVFNRFITLEDQLLRTDLQRAQHALAADLHDLEAYNASYAIWDDTYAFVIDHNPTYIERNYYDQFFRDNRLNLLLVADQDGRVVFGKQFDLQVQLALPLSQRFQHLSQQDPLITGRAKTESTSGIVLLPEGPLLITSHAIVPSEGRAPSRGTLIMGRYLDAAETQRLATSTQLTFAFYNLDDPSIPADIRLAQTAANVTQPIVRALSEQDIAIYSTIDDLDRSAKLVVRLTSPRSIYLQGQLSISSFMVSLLLAGLVFGVVIWLLLDRLILARLSQLSTSVQRIGTSGDLTARVTVIGRDELAHLASDVNRMLVALQHADHERRQTEGVREQARLQTEALQAKRDMLSIVSHELRTPLMPILGYVDLLLLGEGGNLTDDQQAMLKAVQSSTLRLSTLVDDVLDIARLEANHVGLHFRPTDIRAVLTETVRMLQPECQRKEMRLTYDIVGPLPLVEADSKRIGQVLTNLLSNALNYSYPGSEITLRVFCPSDDVVEVQVADQGVGITPEQQQHLFDPFYRADNPLSGQVKGTGLGLSIAKSFVELHGGRLWAESAVGSGSVFAFILPITRPIGRIVEPHPETVLDI